MSWRKTVVFTTSFHVAPTVASTAARFVITRSVCAPTSPGDDLTRRRIDRDLAGGEEETVRDDALRIRTDGGRRLVRVNDLQAHNSLLADE